MPSPLRRHFLHEVEADAAVRRIYQFAEMHVAPRLLGAVAALQYVFRGRGRIEPELPARPFGRHLHGRGGRETVALSFGPRNAPRRPLAGSGSSARADGGVPPASPA